MWRIKIPSQLVVCGVFGCLGRCARSCWTHFFPHDQTHCVPPTLVEHDEEDHSKLWSSMLSCDAAAVQNTLNTPRQAPSPIIPIPPTSHLSRKFRLLAHRFVASSHDLLALFSAYTFSTAHAPIHHASHELVTVLSSLARSSHCCLLSHTVANIQVSVFSHIVC